jgi:chaperonin GroES
VELLGQIVGNSPETHRRAEASTSREIEEYQRSGVFLTPKTPYGIAEGAEGDRDKPHEFLEQHRYWDLDEDGYAEPYVITVHKPSQQVARIVARYDADGIKFNARTHKIAKIEAVEYYTLYMFLPNPDGRIVSDRFWPATSPDQ